MSKDAAVVNETWKDVSKKWAEGDQAKAKRAPMSVYIDDEIALMLNHLREEIRQKNEGSEIALPTPTIGWLARTLLREKLGLVDSRAAKKDNSASV